MSTPTVSALTPAALPAEPDHLPHDIRELLPYPSWFPDAKWLLLLLVLSILCLLGYLWWCKKKQKAVPVPEDPLLTITRYLQNLTPESPFVGKVQQEFFFQLSFALRKYMELTAGFQATDMTLRELKLAIQQIEFFTPERKMEMIRFFERSDLIKFAHAATSLQEAQACHERVLGWIKLWNQIPPAASSLSPASVQN